MFILWYIITLLLILSVEHVQASGGCRDLEFLDCIKNKTLVNHTIHTSNVTSPGLVQCKHKCFINDACVSYNLGPTRGMMRTCNLSNTDHVGYPDHVVVKEGFEYCPIKNPCMSKPCPASQRCKPDYSWDSFICTCDMDISKPLGMEDGRIPDSALTASSVWRIGHEAFQGRLNYVAPSNLAHYSSSCWSAKAKEIGEYLQVDLGQVSLVTMVATQGRDNYLLQCVKSYTLKYSQDATSWIDYKEDGRIKYFQGNSDRTTVVTHKLAVFIEARFVRVVVQTWLGHISLRMELYGCK